jgi:hypothetical protein
MAFDDPLFAEELAQLKFNVKTSFGLPPDVKAALEDWMLGTR